MAKRIEELEFALTKLLGKKSGTCQKKPGEGKDKGTNFYSLVFNDGTSALSRGAEAHTGQDCYL